ncbi:MAG TPA: type II toxin-antitoxin system prevent-host-death family antitoxin [Kiritimatiellia bacterium]|nr:type II toxin-antitoxin system prevent-host-death family antitoxin [Kiritimatiellia bacterium]HMP34538.1 type II toxin-antitoxin system prevent-host-death family antitoxin [Kiritimatiellia bacterium]
MSTISIYEAKAHLSRLVDEVVTGKRDHVVISRHGKAVVRLDPVRPVDASKRIGLAKGRFAVPTNIDRGNDMVAKLFQGKRKGS